MKSKREQQPEEVARNREIATTFSSIKSDDYPISETINEGRDMIAYLKFFKACGGLQSLLFVSYY